MHKIFRRVLSLIALVTLTPILAFAADSSSDNLFEFAEKNYSQYFSPSAANTITIDNYLARYYSNTDIYLGMRGSDVYVYGNVFGGLVNVGKINDFITVPIRIDSLKPEKASTGMEVIIAGEGFSKDLQILFGDQNIEPNSISEKEIRFTVPFGLNAEQELIPLQTGSKIIQAGGSNQVVLQIVDLPNNPNPPGEVINDQINATYEAIAQITPYFESTLPELLESYKNNPVITELLNILNKESNEIVKGSTELITQFNALNPTTLDTLERAILAHNSESFSFLDNAVKKERAPLYKTSLGLDCRDMEGDAWFECRISGSSFISSELANKISKNIKISACNSGFNYNDSIIRAICGKLKYITQIALSLRDAALIHQFGVIRSMELVLPTEVLANDFKLNNADNNEISPSTRALNITNAKLGVSHNIESSDFIDDLVTLVKLYRRIPSTIATLIIPDALIRFAEIYFKGDVPSAEYIKVISMLPLKHFIYDDFIDFDKTFLISDKPCKFPDFGVEFPELGVPQWLPKVTDIGRSAYNTYIGTCAVEILQRYQMILEDRKARSGVIIKATRFPKITVTRLDEEVGDILYSLPSYFGSDSCTNLICKEYFDNDNGKIRELTLTSGSPAVYWIGIGADNCVDGRDCLVKFDSGNNNSPDLTANSYSGIWNVNATDNETGCGEGINSYTLFPLIGVNGNEISISLRPVAWSGSLSPNPNSVAFNINFSEDGGTTAESGSIIFNKGTFTGNSSWSWADGSDSCSGSSAFSGTKS